MYKLFCDSNCELWYETIDELGLEVIKMPYTLGDREYFYDRYFRGADYSNMTLREFLEHAKSML